MAPLRDAMRLVDREEGDPAAPQHVEAMRHHQPLGRDVEEVERAVADRALDRARLARRQPGIQCARHAPRPAATRRPGPSSARSAARRRRPARDAAAPAADSTRICRRRSASGRSHRRRRRHARRSPAAGRESWRSRRRGAARRAGFQFVVDPRDLLASSCTTGAAFFAIARNADRASYRHGRISMVSGRGRRGEVVRHDPVTWVRSTASRLSPAPPRRPARCPTC